jgi:nucleoside-diphosphate-sugar epimerase/glycosyltransferase involved in cell wall biosynthesis
VKIAILSHYFWPEMAAPSARLLELGRAWLAQGHQVSVVTNFPNHPTGVIPESYRGRGFQIEDVQGLRVIRCRTYATPNRGLLKKTLSHFVFMVQSVVQATSALRGVDVLVASSPTLFSVVSAWVISRRLGVPFIFEVRDLWPAIFVDLGIIRSRVVIRCLEWMELFLYRRSAAVVTVTRAFARDIRERGIDPAKVHVIFNGVDLEAFAPGARDPELLANLGLTGKFVVLYCGAHGISHALNRILDVAALVRGDPRIHFLFVGEGAEKDDLVERAASLDLANVTFRPGVPREQVPALYRSADVCLVPLRNIPLFRSFVPSKMFEILACAEPILASVEGEAAEILTASGAALVVPPEDVEALAQAIVHLADDPPLRAALAARGRPFVAAHFDRLTLAHRYLQILERAAGGAADRALDRRMLPSLLGADPVPLPAMVQDTAAAPRSESPTWLRDLPLAGQTPSGSPASQRGAQEAPLGVPQPCLVTGASGFIGNEVARLLRERGYLTVALGRSPVKEYRTLQADLTRGLVDLRNESFRHVYHVAGLAHVEPRANDPRFRIVNVEGTRNLLRSLEQCRELPRSFLLVSTVAVYGIEEGTLLDETTERRAADPYGLSKRQAEELVQEWGERHGVLTSIVRLPLVTGAGARGNLRKMAMAMSAGRYLGVGTSAARRSIVRVTDVAEILPKVAATGGVFHLTDGFHPSLAELEGTLATALGRLPPAHMPMPLARSVAWVGDAVETFTRRGMPFNRRTLTKMSSTLTFSDEKAKRELGWKPTNALAFVGELVDGLGGAPEAYGESLQKRRDA